MFKVLLVFLLLIFSLVSFSLAGHTLAQSKVQEAPKPVISSEGCCSAYDQGFGLDTEGRPTDLEYSPCY